MPFGIDDANLPAILTSHPMTDKNFIAFCARHPDLNVEMTAHGEIILIPPTTFVTGLSNADVTSELRVWARKDGRGVVSDSSTGFVLPNGARRSPDAAWTLKTRLKKPRGFLHLCPDFVIEVRSDTDRLNPLQEKMGEYIQNGAQLGWLIDSKRRSVEIYRTDSSVETRTAIDKIKGEGPVAGFILDLTYVWDPLAD